MDKPNIQRRNIKTSEAGRRPAVPPKPRPKNFAIALTRTNRRGGRKP